ncbi:MAG: D-glycero-beta-D-manno-heptose 1-phosphate adenylyltransferase [Deltaproteobacteria bacterium]|nr:D-glycero-beta-D-manno-heptose 1-phosphate adenylyltransferase [Deltaproteobacteria bacterium]
MAAYTPGKIIEFSNIKKEISKLKKDFKKIVFTNGCFDIIHAGHVSYLSEAKSLGDVLIVGINSDESVKRLKGRGRPIIGEKDRAYILANIKPVDYVVIFDEDTPYNLIKEVNPDFLVKGGDYNGKDVVGKDIVESAGGKVVLIDFVKGKSTSNIIKKIREGEGQ